MAKKFEALAVPKPKAEKLTGQARAALVTTLRGKGIPSSRANELVTADDDREALVAKMIAYCKTLKRKK